MLRSVTFGVFLFGGLVVSGSIFGNASAAVIADDTAGAKPASPETAAAESTDQKSDQKKADAETPAKKVRVDWARIVIEGGYPESRQMPGLFGDLTESLGTCLERLDQAAKDKAIRGVILDIRGVSFGWGRLHEIQTGILSLRNAGKPVWAVMTDASMKEYLLAASCDRIIVPETSTLMLLGLRAEVTFYRNLFENLQIKADMLRVGAFKSAAEPYNRSEMSPEFRQEMEELLDDYYGSILKQISTARKLTEDKVREIIDEGMLPATRAKDLGLIDELAYDDQLMELIRNGDELIDVRIRNDYKKKKPNTELDLFSLMEILSGGSQQKGSTRPRIAVIYAEGAIVSSSVPAGLFGESGISSDKFVPMIQKLATEDNIKAIVLRVDSPGGSALASDLIWRALRSTGKPVVVSMGDVAASGGYYISMGADRIFAEPGTITGSIGVLGGKVSFEGLLNRVGVTMSIVQRGKNAGVMSLSGAFTDSEREVFQRMLDTIYRQFTEKAAAGRKMEYDKLESLARGRVYTGRRAKELGLIDDIGTLADAIAYARQIAGDSENKLELESLPRPQSPLEMLLSSQTAPSADPLSSIIRSLPESLQPAAEHFAALRAIMNETSLTIMPYSLQIR